MKLHREGLGAKAGDVFPGSRSQVVPDCLRLLVVRALSAVSAAFVTVGRRVGLCAPMVVGRGGMWVRGVELCPKGGVWVLLRRWSSRHPVSGGAWLCRSGRCDGRGRARLWVHRWHWEGKRGRGRGPQLVRGYLDGLPPPVYYVERGRVSGIYANDSDQIASD